MEISIVIFSPDLCRCYAALFGLGTSTYTIDFSRERLVSVSRKQKILFREAYSRILDEIESYN